MKQTFFGAWLAVLITTAVASPANAANKEHQQLMADLRILQEQTQLLQNVLTQVTDALKSVNTRLPLWLSASKHADGHRCFKK